MANDENVLRDFVHLYRECDRPSVSDGYFSFSTERASNTLISALNKYSVHSADKITGLSSGQNILQTPLEVGAHINQPISFDCFIPANGFHENLHDLVKNTPSLHKGKMPDSFYTKENDYLHGQTATIDEIDNIERTCRLITFLEKVLTHSESLANFLRFILLTLDKDNNSTRKQLIETRYDYSDVTELVGLEELEEIIQEEDLHSSERKIVFRNAVAEFIEGESDPQKKFIFMLRHFKELKEKYDQNYETYINGFALDKFKMEVVSKSDELINKLNTTLSDIVTKVFVVPASLLVIKAFGGNNNMTTDVMVMFAIGTISFIVTVLVQHQLSNLTQIEANIESLFSTFKDQEGRAIEIAQENRRNLIKKKNSIHMYLWLFLCITWIPPLLCVVYLIKECLF